MQPFPSKSPSKFPPNPAQWQPERNGHSLRVRFGRSVHVRLDPFEIAGRFAEVELLPREKVIATVGAECAAELFGRSKDCWSGLGIPLAGRTLIVLNHTHPVTRQTATLTEELFHIILGHKPSKISVCPISGKMQREHMKGVEDEAYCSAAAALVPYAALKFKIECGDTIEAIAEFFGVSISLVQFRMKTTKLWRRRN